MSDYYSLLGVKPDATATDIRRAFKESALRCHPDKAPEGPERVAATNMFKLLNEAYTTLTTSRASYDAELRRRSSNPAHSFSSVTTESSNPFENEEYRRQFAATFERKMRSEGETPLDGEELFSALFGQARQNFQFDTREKGPDKEIPLPLTLEELHTGCIKRRKLQRSVRDAASGELRPTTTVMRIDILAGYRPGDRIRFRGAGSESDSSLPPDVVFVIEQKEHARFVRLSDDLHVQLPISLSESLAGISTHLTGIDGEQLTIITEAVAKPDETLTLAGKGMARRQQAQQGAEGEARGDLVVHFQVTFPDRLTPSEKRAVRDVLTRIESRSSRPPMRRTASMFTARGRETSDIDTEPRSTGRRAFRGNSTTNSTSPERPLSCKSQGMGARPSRASRDERLGKKDSAANRKESQARKMSEPARAATLHSSPRKNKGWLGLFR